MVWEFRMEWLFCMALEFCKGRDVIGAPKSALCVFFGNGEIFAENHNKTYRYVIHCALVLNT